MHSLRHPFNFTTSMDPSAASQGTSSGTHQTKQSGQREKFAAEEMLYIDPDTCIDCGLCVDECPVTAIFPQEDLPAEWVEFIEKNAAYYKK